MANNFIKYEELKSRVSLMDVAAELGYKLNMKDGMKWPVMVKTDGAGQKLDSIVICHPAQNSTMGYFRHAGGKGDVISFVRENQNELSRYGNSVYRILLHFANMEQQAIQKTNNDWKNGQYNTKDFDLSSYCLESLKNREILMEFIFKARGISQETARVFSDNLLRVTHWQPSRKEGEKPWLATNLGFPYRIPGHSEIVGLELRYSGFKSKVAGSNSSEAVWSMDFNKHDPQRVQFVYFAESPYDLMAMYQIYKHKINLENSAFVATGGAFSNNQILNTMRYYGMAKAVDCFDNDLAGRIYGIRMEMLLEGRYFAAVKQGNKYQFTIDNKTQFSIESDKLTLAEFRKHVDTKRSVAVLKAKPEFKDWNDMLLGKRIDDNMSDKETLKAHNINLIDMRYEKTNGMKR